MKNVFSGLPLLTLYELLLHYVKEMLEAHDADDAIAVKTKKRIISQLIREIETPGNKSNHSSRLNS